MEYNSKSANQLYKESGSELSFKEWLIAEKEKENQFISNEKLNNLIASIEKNNEIISNQNKKQQIFGIPKNVIIISASLITIALIYKYLKK